MRTATEVTKSSASSSRKYSETQLNVLTMYINYAIMYISNNDFKNEARNFSVDKEWKWPHYEKRSRMIRPWRAKLQHWKLDTSASLSAYEVAKMIPIRQKVWQVLGHTNAVNNQPITSSEGQAWIVRTKDVSILCLDISFFIKIAPKDYKQPG